MTLRKKKEAEKAKVVEHVADGFCPFCGQERGNVKICPHCNNSGITKS